MSAVELSDMQIEALKEVGNIGAGHAATALSEMLNEPVQLGTPRVEILPFRLLAGRVARDDKRVTAVHMHVRGDAPGQIVVLFDSTQAATFTSIFTGMTADDVPEFDAIVESTVKEVGNIIGGAYLTALTALTGVSMLTTPPSTSSGSAHDALPELMNVPPDQDVFYVQTRLEKDEPIIQGDFILIPDEASLGPLLSVFGL